MLDLEVTKEVSIGSAVWHFANYKLPMSGKGASFLGLRKGLIEIGKDVVDVFDADGETDEFRPDAT